MKRLIELLKSLFGRKKPAPPAPPAPVVGPPVFVPVEPPKPVAPVEDRVAVYPTGPQGKGKVRFWPKPQASDVTVMAYFTRVSQMIRPETGKPYTNPDTIFADCYMLSGVDVPKNLSAPETCDYANNKSDWWSADTLAREAQKIVDNENLANRLATLNPGEIDIDTVEPDDVMFYVANYVFLNRAAPSGHYLGPWANSNRTSVAAVVNWFQCQGGAPTAKLAAAFPGQDSQFMAYQKYMNDGAAAYNGPFKADYERGKALMGVK